MKRLESVVVEELETRLLNPICKISIAHLRGKIEELRGEFERNR